MATYNSKESAAWRAMVKPLVLALVTLAAAATAYIKAHTENNQNHETVVERIVKLETARESDSFRLNKLERDAELLKASLSNIQSDVSYIRGIMEASEKKGRR